MFHYRKNFKRYKSFPQPIECSFCEDDFRERCLRETEHVFILPNRVSYDLWEMREVVDHLMIVPKAHVRSFSELSDAAKLDIMNIIADYELQGYNIYARGVGSETRSVAHQHTHLIRTKGKRARISLAVRKPYIFVKL